MNRAVAKWEGADLGVKLLPAYSWRAIWQWALHIQSAAIFAADEWRPCTVEALSFGVTEIEKVTSQQIELRRCKRSVVCVKAEGSPSVLYFLCQLVLKACVSSPVSCPAPQIASGKRGGGLSWLEGYTHDFHPIWNQASHFLNLTTCCCFLPKLNKTSPIFCA